MRFAHRLLLPLPLRVLSQALAVMLASVLLVACSPQSGTDGVTSHGTGGLGEVVVEIGAADVDVELDDVTVSVPAGAAPAGTELIISAVVPKDAPVDELDDEHFDLATTMYDFRLASGDQPAVSVELSFPLEEGTDVEHLVFVTLNSETGYWEGVPVDVADGVATVQLSHFSWAGFLFAKDLWDALMEVTGSFLLGISDAPDCYGESLTIDGTVYSVSSSSVLYHPCLEEVDGTAELRVFNSGPYTWRLWAADGLGQVGAPTQAPSTGHEAGDRAVGLLTKGIFSASGGTHAQLAPSTYIPVTIGAAEGTYSVEMQSEAGLSTLYMLLDATVDLLFGEAIDHIVQGLDNPQGDLAALRCVYVTAKATQNTKDVPEILNCLSTLMDVAGLDRGAQRRLSLGIAILASFGPKVTQMITGAYLTITGDDHGTVEVSVTPPAPDPGTEAGRDDENLPPITAFPGCDDFSCYVTDSVRVDHPASGELRLVTIARLDDDVVLTSWEGIDFVASGALFVVDEDGQITDLYGDNADDLWITGLEEGAARTSGAENGTELERLAWNTVFYTGSDVPAEVFRFHSPAVDAGGHILISSPGEMMSAAVTLRVDPEGYFAAPEVVSMYTTGLIDYESIPEAAAPPTDYFHAVWSGTDSSGLGTIDLVSAGDESRREERRTSLRRDGQRWVYDG